MKHLKIYEDENFENYDDTDSLTNLVISIIEACHLDIYEIKESDPEFVQYIADKIKVWHEKNK